MTRLIIVSLIALSIALPAHATVDEQNQKILRDAVIGAVTGAVATQATKDEPRIAEEAATTLEGGQSKDSAKEKGKKHAKKNFSKKDKHAHKHDKKRPYGWDQGKKTGWGDGDVPPGLAKKKKSD